MTVRQPPRLGLLLARLLPPEDSPLVGDLIEAQVDQPHGWFWRQVLFAVLVRTIAKSKASFHYEPIAGACVSLAMLAVLGFQGAVAASLLEHFFEQLGIAEVPWTSVYPHWLASFTTLSFLSALVVGRVAGRVHQRSRVVVVLACGLSVTMMALVTLYLLHPAPMRPFLPSATLQAAAAMVFIIGLFTGFRSTLVCEPPM
ncbi:MAG: hypothetical protein DMF90_23610 [Acidobacteria bacterium]|nr:MAG: hypothetical protein DMF90_23610 [Acidobacteriota bacterium]